MPVNEDTRSDESAEQLAHALTANQINLSPEQVQQLDQYRELLWSFNEKLNLTRHTTLEKFVTRDVLDSARLSVLLGKRERVLDVGTGGGVPGVLLAIMRPDLRISLCESVAKRAQVVESIVGDLAIDVPVYHTRAEEVLEVRTYDTLVARAVARLAKLLKWLTGSWDAFDRLLVIKGRAWVDERGEARHLGLLQSLDLRIVANYQTPGTGAENVVLQLAPKGKLHL